MVTHEYDVAQHAKENNPYAGWPGPQRQDDSRRKCTAQEASRQPGKKQEAKK